MIAYFSGTGNSRHVARQIAAQTGDELVSLNRLIREDRREPLVSQRPFVIVCPTYAWRIPRPVEEYLRAISLEGSRQIYFIMTCGGDTGNAIHYVRALCEEKGMELRGFAELLMPDNYLVSFTLQEQEQMRRRLDRVEPIIAALGADIAQQTPFFLYKKKGLMGALESGPVNRLFYRCIVEPTGFHLTRGRCTGCGRCAELCPLGNIGMEGSRPVWGGDCTHCMACISACPAQAIEYKRRTQGKRRYYLD